MRLPGTAAAREQDAGVWGTPIRRVQGPHLWRSRRLAGDDKPHGPRNTRPALSSCNGPRPQLRHGPNLAVLLPVPVGRCCTWCGCTCSSGCCCAGRAHAGIKET